MNFDEIKRNSPDGATHYNPTGVWAIYYKCDNNGIYFWYDSYECWLVSLIPREKLKPL